MGSLIVDAASAVANVANAAIDAIDGSPSHSSSGVNPEQSHMDSLAAQQEAASVTTSGYRKIQSAAEDSLFFLEQWQSVSNAREENAHAVSLGLEPPNVNTDIPDILFEDSESSSEKTTENESV